MDFSWPNIDATQYGWQADEDKMELHPIALPKNIQIAPDYILALAKCSCKSINPCNTTRCSCVANGLSCSLMCNCLQLSTEHSCKNPHTRISENITSDSEDSEED